MWPITHSWGSSAPSCTPGWRPRCRSSAWIGWGGTPRLLRTTGAPPGGGTGRRAGGAVPRAASPAASSEVAARAPRASRPSSGRDRTRGWIGREGVHPMTEEKVTYCLVCEVYCGLIATVEDGPVVRLRPDDDDVAS